MKHLTLLLMVMTLLLAACGGDTGGGNSSANDSAANSAAVEDTTTTESASDEMAADEAASDDMAADETSSDDMAADEAAADEMAADETSSDEMTVERPAWQTMTLRNAATGEEFTLADYAGKTVFVEPMATWCTNCRAQLTRLKDVYTTLNGEDFVFIALSVETNLEDSRLANYATDQGFPYTFAVLSPEMLAELVREFGSSVSTPPSTPHFIIRPDGTFTGLETGAHSADSLIQTLRTESGL